MRDLVFLYQGHFGFCPKPNEAPINSSRRRFRYRLSTNPALQGSSVDLQNLRRLRDRIFLHIHCAAGAAFVKRKMNSDRSGPSGEYLTLPTKTNNLETGCAVPVGCVGSLRSRIAGLMPGSASRTDCFRQISSTSKCDETELLTSATRELRQLRLRSSPHAPNIFYGHNAADDAVPPRRPLPARFVSERWEERRGKSAIESD